jgi:hypothetical protein
VYSLKEGKDLFFPRSGEKVFFCIRQGKEAFYEERKNSLSRKEGENYVYMKVGKISLTKGK